MVDSYLAFSVTWNNIKFELFHLQPCFVIMEVLNENQIYFCKTKLLIDPSRYIENLNINFWLTLAAVIGNPEIIPLEQIPKMFLKRKLKLLRCDHIQKVLFGAEITTNYHYIIHLYAYLRTHHVITSDVHSQSRLEEFSCKTRFCDVFRWFCGTCSEFNYCPCLCELRCLQVRVSSRKINILWVHTCHVNVDTSFLTALNDEITCGAVHAWAVSSSQLRF